jgi:hypothetical protein
MMLYRLQVIQNVSEISAINWRVSAIGQTVRTFYIKHGSRSASEMNYSHVKVFSTMVDNRTLVAEVT